MKVRQCIYFVFQVGPGRSVTVESTPRQYGGGPVAVTDQAPRKASVFKGALKKIKRDETLDSVKKKSVPVE